jgi:hypothetical protein
MTGKSSPSSIGSTSTQMVPLPYALYESNGLLFELYNGGQRANKHQIQWVRLAPTFVAAPTQPASDCAKPTS